MGCQESFASGGKTIRVEAFAPPEPNPRPAVLILHGSGGMRHSTEMYQRLAEGLAGGGFAAFLPRYFDRTDMLFADPSLYALHFPAWMETIRDALTFMQGRPCVIPDRLGVIGFSLGAYLALSAASQDDRIGAVVDCSGGLPEIIAAAARRLPPTLILHGEADDIVPVSEARKLEKVLQRMNVPHEIQIYPGQGHGFAGPAARDSVVRATAFLDRILRAPA